MTDITRVDIDLVSANNQASSEITKITKDLSEMEKALGKTRANMKSAFDMSGFIKTKESMRQMANGISQTTEVFERVRNGAKQSITLMDGDIKKVTQSVVANVVKMQDQLKSTKMDIALANVNTPEFKETRTQAIKFSSQKKAIDDQIKMELGLTKSKKSAIELAKETKKVGKNMADAGKHSNYLAKTLLSMGTIKKVVGFATSALKKSADWTENLNLFEVTFGKASADTMDFALNIQKAYGIGANEIVRYTGLFKQMSEAIGIAENTSTEMSKTLTTLGYDIASLYNISTKSAMEKLQAGIAGQTKPLRQLGMDITAQSLDKYLGDMGLDYTSKMLNQADKMLLRTIVIVDQAKNAYGDMAKTINTFANQVKVLSGASENFKMAVGDLIIKPATTAITYLNGFIIAMTNVIRAFVPLSKTSGLNDTAESIGKVDEATQDLENTLGLLSFDKFESLSTGDGGASGINGMLTEEFAKKQAEYMAKFNEQMEAIKNKANEVAKSIQGWFMVTDDGKFVEWTEQAKGLAEIIAGLAVFGIVKGILNIKNATGELTKTMKLLKLAISPIGITVIAIAAALLYMYTTNEDFRKSVNNLISTLLKLVGSALEPIVKVLNILMPIITKLLEVIGSVLAVIVNAISWVVDLLEKSHLLDEAIWVVIGTLGFLAAAWAIGKIKDFIDMLKLSKTALLGAEKSISGVQYAVAGLAGAITFLALDTWFSSMDDEMREFAGAAAIVVGSIMAVVAAVLALKTTISWGVGLPILLAGVGAAIAGVKALTPKIEVVPQLAQGGYPDRGQMFIANEAGAELVGNIGGNTAVANNDMIVQAIENAAYRGYIRAVQQTQQESGGNQNINLQLDINGREFARATYNDMKAEGKRRGY